MNWKFIKEWIIVGIIVVGIIVFIFSLSPSIKKYQTQTKEYNDYLYITENCGKNPSDDCVKETCKSRGINDGYCEEVNKNRGWRHRINENKPSVISALIPNPEEGLGYFIWFFFPILFVFVFIITVGIIYNLIRNAFK